jgi:hypothetical protein
LLCCDGEGGGAFRLRRFCQNRNELRRVSASLLKIPGFLVLMIHVFGGGFFGGGGLRGK